MVVPVLVALGSGSPRVSRNLFLQPVQQLDKGINDKWTCAHLVVFEKLKPAPGNTESDIVGAVVGGRARKCVDMAGNA